MHTVHMQCPCSATTFVYLGNRNITQNVQPKGNTGRISFHLVCTFCMWCSTSSLLLIVGFFYEVVNLQTEV